VSPPATDDPFATLGLPVRYRIDAARLRGAHVRLMAAAHPDRAATPVEAAEFARRASLINEAQRTLADPVRRAEAILRLIGAPSNEGATLPQSFLIEAMELREALDEAIAAGDHARIQSLRDDAIAKRDEAIAELDERFDRLDRLTGVGVAGDTSVPPASERASEFAAVGATLSRLRYIVRLIERASGIDRDPSDSEG
jgi:molecular chaperone HscB